MRKTTSKIIALLLALSVLFCLATPAGALEFEGETDDGSWKPSGSGSSEEVDHKYHYFEVLSVEANQNIIAYRFSYIYGDSDNSVAEGEGKDGESCLEIWINSDESHNGKIGYSAFTTDDDNIKDASGKYINNTGFRTDYKNGAPGIPVESLFPKLSKRQYVREQYDGSRIRSCVRTAAEGGCLGSVRYDDKAYFVDVTGQYFMGAALGNDISKLQAWCINETNAEIIAKCLGQEGGIAGMALGDKIVVEPVFLYAIEDKNGNKVWVAMTTTEMAALATSYYELDWGDKAVYGSGDAFAQIGLFSNCLWPKSLYTPEGKGLWNDAPLSKYTWPWEDRETGSTAWISSRFRTWREIMYDGLGVGIVWDKPAGGGDNQEIYDVAATDIQFYSDPQYAQEIEFDKGQYVMYGQQVYTKMTYANYSDRDVYIDAFYDVDALKLPTTNGFSMKVQKGTATTVEGGYTAADFIGRGNLTTRVRIVVYSGVTPYTQYPGDANADDINGRFLDLYAEADNTNLHETNATNNAHTESLYVVYDVEIAEIIMSTASRVEDIEAGNVYAQRYEDGSVRTFGSLPYGETIYVYHTYRNNALAPMNVTGYDTEGNPIAVNGKTVYALNPGEKVTVLAETFVASDENANMQVDGSVYWFGDPDKIMEWEIDKTNNTASLEAGTGYDLAIHNIVLSTAGSWAQVKDSNIIARLDKDGDTVTTEGSQILVGDTVYVYHTYTSDTPTDMSVNSYQNAALAGDPFDISDSDGEVAKLIGKLDTSAAGDFLMSGAIYREGKNNAAGETNTENNLANIEYTVICYDVELTDILLYSDSGYTTEVDPMNLRYGQTVYVKYVYTNNGSTPIKVDGYNANDMLITQTAVGVELGVGETKAVRGGSVFVNWIGNNTLDGTVRIVKDDTADPYQSILTEPANGKRLLPLTIELHEENRKGQLGNNYCSIGLAAYYDVAITKITLRDGNGEILNPAAVPFGEKVYVYHTYHNYASGSLKVTGYTTDGGTVYHNGSSSYVVPAGGEIEVLAESYTVGMDTMTHTLVGSVYKYDDTNKEMEWETNKLNNRTELTATSSYDLAITNILLMNGSGQIIGQLDDNGNVVTPDGGPLEVYRGERVSIYHTYTSDTPGTIQASGYVNDKIYLPDGSGSFFTLGGNLTDNTLFVGYLDTSEIGDFVSKGAVYYKFTTNANAESNPHNNVAQIQYTVVEGLPWLEAIEPNKAYREGTEVITSFYVHNDTSAVFTPDAGLKVRMWVLDGDSGLPATDENGDPIVLTQSVVVPDNEVQLIYFRWTVPTLENTSKRFVICADYTITGRLNGEWVGKIAEGFYKYKAWEVDFTPDTQYEADMPDYWSRATVGDYENASTNWSRWEYINGAFRKVNYGVLFQPGTVKATPTSVTAFKDTVTGYWNMKSGYGFTLESDSVGVRELSGYILPDADAYTLEQYCYALYPEFEYKETYQERSGISTLEPKALSGFHLYEFVVTDKNGNDKNYGRVHWTPIWYPDGKYFVKVIQQDIWTPAGAVEVVTISNRIDIKDNMYSDWYIGHG